MPRPRRDGSPARKVPNRRRLSDTFVKTVEPDPDRVTVYWDTLQHGLALAVQPSGHRAWKCVYTVHGRGARWYAIGNAKAISLTEARRLVGKLMVAVAEGGDPHADRLALRGRGSFEQVARRYVEEHASKRNKSWRQADALVSSICCRGGPSSISAASGGPMSKPPSRPSRHRSWRTRCSAAASAIFSWAVRQEIIPVNPCSGVEKNDTTSRERVLSDAEIAAFWPQLSAPLKMILLTGQRPGEVAHLHRAHIIDERWWAMPGAPDAKTGGPAPRTHSRIGSGCPSLSTSSSRTCSQLPPAPARCSGTCATSAPSSGCSEKVTPHDLRRTFCSKVTALGSVATP